LPTGQLTPLGRIEVPLAQVRVPTKLTVTLSLQGTDVANDWDVWVYPADTSVTVPPEVRISQALDEATLAALADGKKVLLLASPAILAKSLPGSFTPVFWSPIWFNNGAGTMSILCDPKHPALAQFPTEEYTNWQWYDLLQRSRSVILDDTPSAFRPLVQVIDNFSRNHKLGNLFEARVGRGRLLVCSLDLWSDLEHRPAARQMLRSLLAYAASEEFRPAQELSVSTLSLLLRPPSALAKMRAAPPSLENAVLHVKAAVNVPVPEKPEPWKPEADQVIVRHEGFDYSVQGGTWRDSVGAAWHDSQNLVVRITCPKGFQGKLYAHFHDWNRLGRVTDIYFEGHSLGSLEGYEAGVWLGFPVTAPDSADGQLELSARPMAANTMITQIVLVK
jgi:hypothetical protein